MRVANSYILFLSLLLSAISSTSALVVLGQIPLESYEDKEYGRKVAQNLRKTVASARGKQPVTLYTEQPSQDIDLPAISNLNYGTNIETESTNGDVYDMSESDIPPHPFIHPHLATQPTVEKTHVNNENHNGRNGLFEIPVAPDATEMGKYTPKSLEYRFPATLDEGVLRNLMTELWAMVYYPAEMEKREEEGENERHPVLVFLHGNHATCGMGHAPRMDNATDYTYTGTCPEGYVVSPSHLGYSYIAERLASHGYVVVSINANRGITGNNNGVGSDRGLTLARGRLILRHLQLLHAWDHGEGPTDCTYTTGLNVIFKQKLDFKHVGCMGHSRGGEGCRAAFTLYTEKGSRWPKEFGGELQIRAIFELAPVDGMAGRVLNAQGAAWGVLVGSCDGDVVELDGMKPYDRMTISTVEEPGRQITVGWSVRGAIHNDFNTEWQLRESPVCTGGDVPVNREDQKQIALHALMSFFRGNVGKNAEKRFNALFDPLYRLPDGVWNITEINRLFTPSLKRHDRVVVEDFTRPTGTNMYGERNIADHLLSATHGPISGRDQVFRAVHIKWNPTYLANLEMVGPEEKIVPVYTIVWGYQVAGHQLRNYTTLDLDIARPFSRLNNASEPTDFLLTLLDSRDNELGTVSVGDFLQVGEPASGPAGHVHASFSTVRIPLTLFRLPEDPLDVISGLRMTFNKTATGAVYIGMVRFTL